MKYYVNYSISGIVEVEADSSDDAEQLVLGMSVSELVDSNTVSGEYQIEILT